MVETTMELSSWLRKQLEEASPDLLRAMVQDFAEGLMGAEADALCGAAYGERSSERVNRRNGYRGRDWDTRVGSIELAVPKLRAGSYLVNTKYLCDVNDRFLAFFAGHRNECLLSSYLRRIKCGALDSDSLPTAEAS